MTQFSLAVGLLGKIEVDWLAVPTSILNPRTEPGSATTPLLRAKGVAPRDSRSRWARRHLLAAARGSWSSSTAGRDEQPAGVSCSRDGRRHGVSPAVHILFWRKWATTCATPLLLGGRRASSVQPAAALTPAVINPAGGPASMAAVAPAPAAPATSFTDASRPPDGCPRRMPPLRLGESRDHALRAMSGRSASAARRVP
jgi:hypothetical protein